MRTTATLFASDRPVCRPTLPEARASSFWYRAARVTEYWIVDPASASVEVLSLRENEYVRHGLFRRSDLLRSRLFSDLEIPLAEVFPPI